MRCCLAAILCLLLSGCAAADALSVERVAGDYRRGSYPDAQYLSLHADGSFALRMLDRSGNGLDESAPPKTITVSGTWLLAHGEVALRPSADSVAGDFTTRYAPLGTNAVDGLQPVYGAGYKPPKKFIRTSTSALAATRPKT